MKIYKVTCHDPFQGALLSWAPNKREAEKDRSCLRAMYKDEEYPPAIAIELIDFPETKAAVISWLNSEFKSDNG